MRLNGVVVVVVVVVVVIIVGDSGEGSLGEGEEGREGLTSFEGGEGVFNGFIPGVEMERDIWGEGELGKERKGRKKRERNLNCLPFSWWIEKKREDEKETELFEELTQKSAKKQTKAPSVFNKLGLKIG